MADAVLSSKVTELPSGPSTGQRQTLRHAQGRVYRRLEEQARASLDGITVVLHIQGPVAPEAEVVHDLPPVELGTELAPYPKTLTRREPGRSQLQLVRHFKILAVGNAFAPLTIRMALASILARNVP
jgi:hypothetical protein